jgi:hypothetical protein
MECGPKCGCVWGGGCPSILRPQPNIWNLSTPKCHHIQHPNPGAGEGRLQGCRWACTKGEGGELGADAGRGDGSLVRPQRSRWHWSTPQCPSHPAPCARWRSGRLQQRELRHRTDPAADRAAEHVLATVAAHHRRRVSAASTGPADGLRGGGAERRTEPRGPRACRAQPAACCSGDSLPRSCHIARYCAVRCGEYPSPLDRYPKLHHKVLQYPVLRTCPATREGLARGRRESGRGKGACGGGKEGLSISRPQRSTRY